MQTFYWVWVGGALLLVYGIAKGLIIPDLKKKNVQALLYRLSVYLLFSGCALIALGLLSGADQLSRQHLGHSIIAWAVIFLSVIIVLMIWVWVRTSKDLRRSEPLEISELRPQDWYILEAPPNFAELPEDRIKHTGAAWEDVVKARPHLADLRRRPGLNHIICFDGTWNDAESATNVRRLFDLLENTCDGKPQIARYYTGVGINENENLSMEVHGEKVTRGLIPCATGSGERTIRWQAYFDLVATYQPGDRLFIFGFSRGASSARIVSNFIHDYGIPEKIQAKYQRAPKYKGQPIGPDKLRFLAVLGERKPIDIEMIGVWDTVAAFGLPSNKFEPFRKLTIPSNIKKGYHLVAIDEKRWEFDVTLTDYDARIEEIWFAGAHTNVGGGSGNNRLSDIALRYMIDRAKDQGICFKPEADKIVGDSLGPEWSLWRGWPTRKTRQIRVKGNALKYVPKIHTSVFERMDSHIGYDPANVRELEKTYTRAELTHQNT